MENKIKRIIEEPDRLFKVTLPKENPFKEGTSAWHCFIDVSCSVGVGAGAPDLLSLAVMIKEHEQDVEYYETYLGELIELGFLKEQDDEKQL